MKQGDKVKYKPGGSGHAKSGVIHGIRKVDIDGEPKIISYVIDTGKDIRVDELRDNKNKVIETTRQPETVDVEPEFVEAA